MRSFVEAVEEKSRRIETLSIALIVKTSWKLKDIRLIKEVTVTAHRMSTWEEYGKLTNTMIIEVRQLCLTNK